MTSHDRSDAAFAAMSDVVPAIASELSVERSCASSWTLRGELVGARYAAIGVPIVARGDVVGLFSLTDKEPGFSDEDQRLIELLAAHAAIAIENARLPELTRELSVAQERTRLAHELHDAMNQTLFSLALVAETAAGAVRADPAQAEHELQTVKALARSTLAELRTAIHGLRPPTLEADGLAAALGHHVEVLRRAHGLDVTLRVSGDRRGDPDREREVVRMAQEALGNVLRHAQATTVAVEVTLDGPALAVYDDGAGFDPAARPVRARHLGLRAWLSMRSCCRAGGHLSSEPEGKSQCRRARRQLGSCFPLHPKESIPCRGAAPMAGENGRAEGLRSATGFGKHGARTPRLRRSAARSSRACPAKPVGRWLFPPRCNRRGEVGWARSSSAADRR
ncbi:MAG: GAF domain-containing sensor histidine kinase [Egibacteraceae bacterium]